MMRPPSCFPAETKTTSPLVTDLTPASAPASGPPGASDRFDGPVRVLLITDQPVLAELIRLTLTHAHFAVRTAATVAAAAALPDQAPHLAVLDMDIEGMGGARLMAGAVAAGVRMGDRVAGSPIVAQVPVIALTRRGDL